MDVGVGVADDDGGEHVNAQPFTVQAAEIRQRNGLLGPKGVPHNTYRGIGTAVLQVNLAGFFQLAYPPAAARVVQDGNEIAGRGSLQAPAYLLPGREQIAQADGAEVLHQRRSQQRRRRLQRRNSRHRFHRRNLSVPLAIGEDAKHRPGHAVDAGVAGGHHRDGLAGVRDVHGQGGPFQFLAQFHGVADLARRIAGDLLDVIVVADQLVAVRDGGSGGRRQMTGVAGAQPHQVEFAFAHIRLTSQLDHLGTRATAMVARSDFVRGATSPSAPAASIAAGSETPNTPSRS